MEKRGELTSTQIVGIVLAIAGFIILLVFLGIIFANDGTPDREACRLSVVTRATVPIGSLQASVPLKCTTEKVCITTDRRGECTQFTGEENIRRVYLSGDVNSSTDRIEMAGEIERISAEQMYLCWSMMGQGKLNIFQGNERGPVLEFIGGDALGMEALSRSSCVICSRVALADDVPESVRNLTDVNRYMANNVIPLPGATETYLEAFTDHEFSTYPQEFIQSANNEGVAKPDQVAFVFMQILAPESVWKSGVDAGLRGGIAFAGGAVMSRAGILRDPRILGLGTLGTALTTGGFSAYNAYASRHIAGGYCGNLTGEGDFSSGCSIVAPVEYSAKNINDLCHFLEGSP